ncbi:MAG: hypothetical protein BMS9Abin07_0177 [Acidimicrobiia bacterium]|nr:MAG: hypothetical protein BMS9Abin07_0177 [Acidimicrobiia bacterium]
MSEESRVPGPESEAADEPDGSDEKWPWSFILLIVSAAIYLGWRLIQGIVWVVDWVGG